jgi:hypothetical protein
MPEISKITLPSGNTYDIKDATAREMISGGVQFIIAWDGTSTPVVADIPAGVKVTYQDTEYTGTLSAENAQPGAFYLVISSTQTSGGALDVYDEYVPVGTAGSKTWEKIGDTQVDLSDVVKTISINDGPIYPDNDNNVDLTSSLLAWFENLGAAAFMLDGSTDSSVTLKHASVNLTTGQLIPGESVSYTNLLTYLMLPRPIYVLRNDPLGGYQLYHFSILYQTTESGVTTYGVQMVYHMPYQNRFSYADVHATSSDAALTGAITTNEYVTSVTLNKQTDVVLGEATSFALSSGAVTHGSLTNHTTKVLGEGTTFIGMSPGVDITPVTKYLSGSASGGGASWNSKDQKTVVTGYSNPSSDTFVKSVSAETNKNLVTTTVPNVTGNTNVSIPNVTGNTSVTIPNVTSVGAASTWSFTMGSGANAETLIIGGANGTAPTLGTNLTATNTTLGTNLSASKVTLGTAITVATGETSTTGTGDAVVTGVTIGSSASALTGLGTPSTANVIGASSTFTNTQPTVTLTASDTSGAGKIEYMQSATAALDSISIDVSVDRIVGVDAITSMPTSTVGTAITVGTNDKVTALTNATTITTS